VGSWGKIGSEGGGGKVGGGNCGEDSVCEGGDGASLTGGKASGET